jgi:hypothetical protein
MANTSSSDTSNRGSRRWMKTSSEKSRAKAVKPPAAISPMIRSAHPRLAVSAARPHTEDADASDL